MNLKRSIPIILSAVGSIGVITTAVLAAKETPRAIELIKRRKIENEVDELTVVETVSTVLPVYAPAIISGFSTIACIMGGAFLNSKQQSALIAAQYLTKQKFGEYRDIVKKKYGTETDKKIMSEITREHCYYHKIDLKSPDTKYLFYEPISDRYFEKYEREVMDAEYHLNRMMNLLGCMSVNDFYEFLGLSKTKNGDNIGWDYSCGYSWIDIQHTYKKLPNGKMGIELEYLFAPDEDYWDDMRNYL